MKSTCKTGNITQLKVQLKLIELGYQVFLPVGDGSKTDLVFEKDGKLCKAQVKTSREKTHGKWLFNAYAVSNSKRVKYDAADVDYFITIGPDDDLYIIPLEAVTSLEPLLHLYSGYIVLK